jgi:hypothetical protein
MAGKTRQQSLIEAWDAYREAIRIRLLDASKLLDVMAASAAIEAIRCPGNKEAQEQAKVAVARADGRKDTIDLCLRLICSEANKEFFDKLENA